MPEEMRAVRMHGYGGPDVLRVDAAPVPHAADNQVRIRVRAVGINPFEWKLREGRMRARFDPPMPFTPGNDVAGVIDEVGAGSDWRVGDEVVAALHNTPFGGYAEYAVVRARDVAHKPAQLSFDQAAGLPTAGCTAWRFLVELGGLKSGQHVFVQGGAGGVGSAALQIAKAFGATVVTTASAHNIEYVRAFGADRVINYRFERYEPALREADIVLDTVGGESLSSAPASMKAGATLISPAGPPPIAACEPVGVRCPPTDWPPTPDFGERLRAICGLVEAGKFRVNVDRVFPLERAAIAQELNRQGHTRGKIVLAVGA